MSYVWIWGKKKFSKIKNKFSNNVSLFRCLLNLNGNPLLGGLLGGNGLLGGGNGGGAGGGAPGAGTGTGIVGGLLGR